MIERNKVNKSIFILLYLSLLLVIYFSIPSIKYIITDGSEFSGFIDEKNYWNLPKILLSSEIIKTPPLMRLIPQTLYVFTSNISLLRLPSFFITFFLIPMSILIWGESLWNLKQRFFLTYSIILSPCIFLMTFSFRGYILLAFFALAATLNFCNLIETHSFNSAKWMLISLILGSWTHYYFCLYAICLIIISWSKTRFKFKEKKYHFTTLYFLSISPLIVTAIKGMIYWFPTGQKLEGKADSPIQLIFNNSIYVIFLLLCFYWLYKEKPFKYIFLSCIFNLLAFAFIASLFPVHHRHTIPFIVCSLICCS